MHRDAQHLSFHRTRRKSVRTNLTGPRARAVYDFRGYERCLGCGHARYAVIREIHRDYFIPGRKVDAAILCGFQRSLRERSWIDAALLQIKNWTIACH